MSLNAFQLLRPPLAPVDPSWCPMIISPATPSTNTMANSGYPYHRPHPPHSRIIRHPLDYQGEIRRNFRFSVDGWHEVRKFQWKVKPRWTNNWCARRGIMLGRDLGVSWGHWVENEVLGREGMKRVLNRVAREALGVVVICGYSMLLLNYWVGIEVCTFKNMNHFLTKVEFVVNQWRCSIFQPGELLISVSLHLNWWPLLRCHRLLRLTPNMTPATDNGFDWRRKNSFWIEMDGSVTAPLIGDTLHAVAKRSKARRHNAAS